MTAIHVFGRSETDEVNSHHQPLSMAAAGTLNSLLPESGVSLFVNGPAADENAFQKAQSALNSTQATVALVEPGSDFGFLASQLPVSLASLAMAPESRCAVAVDVDRLRAAGGFRDVDSPLRELIVRLSLEDENQVVTVFDRDPNFHDCLAPINADLPLVEPSWPRRSHRWLASTLGSLCIGDVLPDVSSGVEVTALHAGLWQMNDWLDESHQCSQSIEGDGEGNGDYWHAIMHRREPDPGNAKYWFRRVGQHRCFEPLARAAETAIDESGSAETDLWKSRLGIPGSWDAAAFVDFCQSTSRSGDTGLAQAARRIQWAEMILLAVHTAQAAVS